MTAASASKLAVTTQPPSSLTANTDFEVDVAAEDRYGNVDQSFTGPLTIAVSSGPSGSALVGTTTVDAVAGVASFPDLLLDAAGAGYKLTVTGATVSPITTQSFTVTPAAVLEFAASTQSRSSRPPGRRPSRSRASGYEGAVTVNVATSGGTAVAGVNYTSLNTSLSFPANQNSETISIPLLNAGVIPDLTVNIVLSSPGSAASLGSPASNTLTIHRAAPRRLRRRHFLPPTTAV